MNLILDSNCGKKSLIPVNIFFKIKTNSDNFSHFFFIFHFRDIAGQERFSSMTRAYYKGAVGAVVMFDQV